MIREAISLVVERESLTEEMAHAVMSEMMDGSATPAQIASLITAMRMKGETEEELVGFVRAMRENAMRIAAPEGAVDLCGTGGDGLKTFNISTVASFVVAASGVPVAKHGNRSVSSRSGSADLLMALGIPIDLDPELVEKCLRSSDLGFMFAPVFHRSMRNVLGPRREVGIRTFFNILGPMTNPAGVKHQLIGVYDPKLAPLMAGVLRNLGTETAMIVNGSGMDEITLLGSTRVVELNRGEIREYDIGPEDFGLDIAEPDEMVGGDPVDNARIALSILHGEDSPRADIVALNAAAAIYVSGRAMDLAEGFEIARNAIRSGKSFKKAEEFSKISYAFEKERQSKQEVGELRNRKLHPDILVKRCGEIASDIMSQIEQDGMARKLSEALDKEALLQTPSVLSVLMLNRVLRIGTGGIPDAVQGKRSNKKLSETICSSRGVSLICEYKPASPTTVPLSVPPDPRQTAEIYSSSDIAGVSVLVEPDHFSGGHELFSLFRLKVASPMLFKDFVMSEEQVELAGKLGADAILLIAKGLRPETIDRLSRSCISKGIEPIVELHDEADLKKFESCDCFDSVPLTGINSRDLRTLKVDLGILARLRDALPSDRTVIAESGVGSAADIAALRGFDAALVGTILMRSQDIRSDIDKLVTAGRESDS